MSQAGGKDPDFLNTLNEFKNLLTAFRQTRDQEVMQLAYQGKNDEAKKLALGIQDERYTQLRTMAFKMADYGQGQGGAGDQGV